MMPELIADCPRCGAQKITFDVLAEAFGWIDHGWRRNFETFCVCRHCHRSTAFVLAQAEILRNDADPTPPSLVKGSVNDGYTVLDYISEKNMSSVEPPEHLPEKIEAAFREGAACVAVGCNNAAAAMFRLCVDHATKSRLPEDETGGLTNHIRRNLSPRMEWLFKTKRLPADLEELSVCIKDHGNDGAHDGSVTPEDAADMQDFAVALLDRLYTEPMRVELAKQRRAERHKAKA